MALQDLSFLVVEDHDFQRNLLSELLTLMGAAQLEPWLREWQRAHPPDARGASR